MTEPLTPERLAEITARADAATEGPWLKDELRDGSLIVCVERVQVSVSDGEARLFGALIFEAGHATPRDVEFVAHARQDVPALLAEVDRLNARVAELERQAPDGSRCYHGDVIGTGDCPGCDNEAATFREGWQR